MSVSVTWRNETRVVYAKVTGEYTIEDMEGLHDQIIADYLNSAQDPVHLLIDVREMTGFPKSINKVRIAANKLLHHPMMGWMVAVGKDNPAVNFFATVITQTFGIKFHWARTLEDGEAYLQRINR